MSQKHTKCRFGNTRRVYTVFINTQNFTLSNFKLDFGFTTVFNQVIVIKRHKNIHISNSVNL